MEQFVEILTGLSSIIGVPATLCLAWAVFVIKDHAKRIKQLEDDLKEADKNRAGELNAIYDRINQMASDVSFIKGALSERYTKDGMK
jgi:hypothetical protein